MSRSGPAGGFSHSSALVRSSSKRKRARMTSNANLSLEDFRRLPGLFRRWELMEILRPGVHYHLEHAGSMQDGTPLLAVFTCDPTTSENVASMHPVASSWGAPSVPAR
jgi:hypothetical protein